MINTIVDSYTNSMKAIISMGAHVITHTELDKVVELSTAFGKAAHKRFGDLLVVIFNSWKASFNEALAAESDREVYLASTLEYWTSVQSRLQENSYKTAALQLDDLIDDALLQLHYAAQTVEQVSFTRSAEESWLMRTLGRVQYAKQSRRCTRGEEWHLHFGGRWC